MPIVINHQPAAATIATGGRLAGLAQYMTTLDNRAFQGQQQTQQLDATAARQQADIAAAAARQTQQIGSAEQQQLNSLANSQYLAQLGEYGTTNRQNSQLQNSQYLAQLGVADGQYQQQVGIGDAQYRQNQQIQAQQQLAAASAQADAQRQQAQIYAQQQMAGYQNRSQQEQMMLQAGLQGQQRDQQFAQQNYLGEYAPAYTMIAKREYDMKQSQLQQQYGIAWDSYQRGDINEATFQQMQQQIREKQVGVENSFRYDPMELQGKFEGNVVKQKYKFTGMDGVEYEGYDDIYMDPRTGQIQPIESSTKRSEYQAAIQKQKAQEEMAFIKEQNAYKQQLETQQQQQRQVEQNNNIKMQQTEAFGKLAQGIALKGGSLYDIEFLNFLSRGPSPEMIAEYVRTSNVSRAPLLPHLIEKDETSLVPSRTK